MQIIIYSRLQACRSSANGIIQLESGPAGIQTKFKRNSNEIKIINSSLDLIVNKLE